MSSLPFDIGGYTTGVHTDDIVSGWDGQEGWPGKGPAPVKPFPATLQNLRPGSDTPAEHRCRNRRSEQRRRALGATELDRGHPAVRPVAMTLPALPQGAPTAAAEADSGGMLSGMALAGMAGRAMAGTVGTGVSRDGKTPRAGTRAPAATKSGDKVVAEEQEPQGKPRAVVTGVAAELREFTKLRDEGILTDEEYTEQKNRLLGR